MQNRILLFLAITSFSIGLLAQAQPNWKQLDEKMHQLPKGGPGNIGQLGDFINQNFKTDTEKIQAIYYWLGTQIDYDLRSLGRAPQDQSIEVITQRTFDRRKGVCEGFAGLMDTLCKITGIPVHTIHGFTRQNGQIDALPHAWIAAKVKGKWYLFDPTFASGSVEGRKYVREFDDKWFMVSPERMIETHMPYDPIWQFLTKPVTYKSFASGKKTGPLYSDFFAYEDSIRIYLMATEENRLRQEQRRILQNKYKHTVVDLRLNHLQEVLRVKALNERIDSFNKASSAFNEAASLYNSYANQRNQQRLDDRAAARLANLLIEARQELENARNSLNEINKPPPDLGRHIRELRQSIDQLSNQIAIELRNIGSSK
jgi:hypothetical protein